MNAKTVFKMVKFSEKLKPLSRVLANLESVHQQYNDYEMEDWDYTFWYNERPQIGLLAAAAWRTENVTALEEFRTEKKGTKSGGGRCDLFIRVDERTGFECEAKHGRLTLGNNCEEMKRKALSVLNLAIEDCKKLTHENISRLALGFITLKIKGKEKGDYWKRVENLLESLKTSCHGLFWIGTPLGFKDEDEKPNDLHGLIFMIHKTK